MEDYCKDLLQTTETAENSTSKFNCVFEQPSRVVVNVQVTAPFSPR